METDISLESNIVGTLALHPEFTYNVSYLTPNMFNSFFHRQIFEGINLLVSDGIENIDAINLYTAIRRLDPITNATEENIYKWLMASRSGARETLEEYKVLVNTLLSQDFKRDLSYLSGRIQKQCSDP